MWELEGETILHYFALKACAARRYYAIIGLHCGRFFATMIGRETKMRVALLVFASITFAVFGLMQCTAIGQQSQTFTDRLPQDEVIYFVIPDRFADGDPGNNQGDIDGGRTDHGFDPTHKGFYHGGDLKGLTDRLDYISGLGATAIWLGPIYKNKAVQGRPGQETAGYHGYWITDFTDVDPHLGTKADLQEFVDAAHERDLKVYLDIIVNHTADVIYYEECHGQGASDELGAPGACPYRSKAEYPYTKSLDGETINTGFEGGRPALATAENFERLTNPNYAYTPRIPEGAETLKVPAWLNDPKLYHNRGDSAWYGENSIYGDFAGLDDLFTENPIVQNGFIEIYKQWITDYRIDGFRIDTAKHVNPEFWPAFNGAMLKHAKSLGIENFYIFGEVYSGDPIELARFTKLHGFPTVLDFAFMEAAIEVISGEKPTDRLAQVFRGDALYAEGTQNAQLLPTFIGSHDAGRFSHFMKKTSPEIDDQSLFQKTRLGHALMFFGRGVPVIYYGDEQGFVGDGGDQDAREDMFASRVESYNDNDLIATDATTADSNFDQTHPLYLALAEMADVYKAEETIRRGRQITRLSEPDGGVLVLSRINDTTGEEILFAMNASSEERSVRFEVSSESRMWSSLFGDCALQSQTASLYGATIPANEFLLCKSK